MLAAIARGDVAEAIALWQLATGRTDVPAWLRAFEAAFNASNQKAGPCLEVARSVFEGFRRLGQSPQFVRLASQGTGKLADRIGFQMWPEDPGSTIQISVNAVHYAVQLGPRLYDAMTGPAGMLVGDYMQRIMSPGGPIIITVVSGIP
jgi:hypothetical protein